MSKTDMTIEEITESLTGFDEIAIAKNFGAEWMELGESRPMAFSRALVFVHLRRGGLNDAKAFQAAMELTIREATEYFADDPADLDSDDPDSESGKDGSGPDRTPES